MPEFLVRIALSRPREMEDESWTRLLAREAEVASVHRNSGVISRIWRVPGTTGNIGIWRVADASQLHEHLSGLPAFPYMRVQVEALARHYLEAPPPDEVGAP